MSRRRMVLINPVRRARVGMDVTVQKFSIFPPISLGVIAALTPPSWEVVIADENWEPFTYQEADLVGITAFTSTASRAYEIASMYRKNGIPTILGGIHASMCPQEALGYVDAVVMGEAESVWPQVLADFEAGSLGQIYKGEYTDLTKAPVPRRDLFNPNYMLASVQTSRGCPMDCDFCSVSAFNGKRYRRRPAREVLDELEGIRQKVLLFVDDNIIGYGSQSRETALKIFKGMVERKLNKWWYCQASLNFGDDEEVLEWAGRSGCKIVLMGLEAEDVDALREMNKPLNLKRGVDSYSQAFRRMHRAGIAVLGAFIFGFDGDTPEKLQKRADYIINSDVDVMQITPLTPFPGTKIFDKYLKEQRLLFNDFPKDWMHYDLFEVTHRPGCMESEELGMMMFDLSRQVYAWPVLLRKALKTLYQTRSLFTAVFALMLNISYRRLALGGAEALRQQMAQAAPTS